MNLGMQYVAAISVAIAPFMPFTSEKLRKMLNLPALDDTAALSVSMLQLAEGEQLIADGHKIGVAEHLFQRIDDETINTQIEKLKTKGAEPVEIPISLVRAERNS